MVVSGPPLTGHRRSVGWCFLAERARGNYLQPPNHGPCRRHSSLDQVVAVVDASGWFIGWSVRAARTGSRARTLNRRGDPHFPQDVPEAFAQAVIDVDT